MDAWRHVVQALHPANGSDVSAAHELRGLGGFALAVWQP